MVKLMVDGFMMIDISVPVWWTMGCGYGFYSKGYSVTSIKVSDSDRYRLNNYANIVTLDVQGYDGG